MATTETTVSPPTESAQLPVILPTNALTESRLSLEKAAKSLRAQVTRDAAEVARLSEFLRNARAELKRTERLLAAADRIEHPRSRKAKA